MCGVLGCFSKSGLQITDKYAQEINHGLDLLHHRGPDNKSLISSSDQSLILGHRRLAIIDLSESDYIEVYSRISDASGSPEMDGSGSTLSEFTGYKLI